MGFLIVVLLLVTFATLPRVDYVEPNVLFYLKHLTPFYYVCVFAAVAMTIYYRRDLVGLLSLIVLGLLILWTPSIMLVQPWFLDSYPFAAEAVYVVRNGHLGDFHFLSVSPPLGLTFGSFLMITGISPFILQKIYPGLFATIFVLLLYVTAKKMKIGKESLVVAPLLFISIAWPNEFHLSRQSISLIYYLASWLFLSHLIFQRRDRRILVLLVLQIFILTMSHPATPLFFVTNLVAIAFFGWMWPKFRLKEFRVVIQTLLISAVTWILWNSLMPTWAIGSLVNMSENLVKSILENPSEISGAARIFQTYTPIYSLVINIRFALTFAVFVSAVLLLFIMYRYPGDSKVLLFLTAWIISNIFSSVPLLYSGLGFFSRPSLFTFISWAPLGALVYNISASKSGTHVKIKSVAKRVFLVAFVIVPLIFIPIIKYAPLPFLYPTSRELANKEFLDLHGAGGGKVAYLEFNLPYGYSYILHGIGEPAPSLVHFANEGSDPILASKSTLWITYRLITRDAFWNYTPSMLYIVKNLTLYQTIYNKVYDSGWPDHILIPRSESPK